MHDCLTCGATLLNNICKNAFCITYNNPKETPVGRTGGNDAVRRTTLDQNIPSRVLSAYVNDALSKVLPEFGYMDLYTEAQDLNDALHDMSQHDSVHVLCEILTALARAKRAPEPPF